MSNPFSIQLDTAFQKKKELAFRLYGGKCELKFGLMAAFFLLCNCYK